MSNRKKIIDAIVSGDIKQILQDAPQRYFFTVWDHKNEVEIIDYRTNPTTHTKRKYIKNYEECLTDDEKRYMRQCDLSDRLCCIIFKIKK